MKIVINSCNKIRESDWLIQIIIEHFLTIRWLSKNNQDDFIRGKMELGERVLDDIRGRRLHQLEFTPNLNDGKLSVGLNNYSFCVSMTKICSSKN